MPISRAFWRLILLPLTIVGVLMGLVIINQVDEVLSPEAAAFYEAGRLPALTEQRGFALMIGLSAPVDQDPRRFAAEWSAAMNRAGMEGKPHTEYGETLRYRGSLELLCRPEAEDCVEKFRARPGSVDEGALDNRVLLGRYEELLSVVDVGDADGWLYPTSPFGDVQLITHAQSLALSRIAVSAARGDMNAALAALETDAAFHRRWLSQGRSLIAKMIAARTFSRDVLLGMQLLRHLPSPTSDQLAVLTRVSAPLSRDELSLGGAMHVEARIIANIFDRTRLNRHELGEVLGTGVFVSHLLTFGTLRNATLNMAYRPYASLARLDANGGIDRSAGFRAVEDEIRTVAEPDWTWFYNPTGRMLVAKWLVDDGVIHNSRYFVRIRDLDGLVRLVCSIVDLRANRVQRAEVEGYQRRSDKGCHDRSTGRPMHWDGPSGTLSFKPINPENVIRFGGSGDRISFLVY